MQRRFLGQTEMHRCAGVRPTAGISYRMRTLPRSTGDMSIVDIHEQIPLRGMSDLRTHGLTVQAELFQPYLANAVPTGFRSFEAPAAERQWAVCPIKPTIY